MPRKKSRLNNRKVKESNKNRMQEARNRKKLGNVTQVIVPLNDNNEKL